MKPKGNGVVIGIDLGTTLSGVAIYEADTKVRMLANADGELLTPSVVNLRDEQRPVVGTAALNELAFAPEFSVRLVKRSMGKRDAQGNPVNVLIHPTSGKTYVPEEISALIIRYLVDSVEAGLGVHVAGVVITVPAYFDDPPRVATRRAGELAGVKVLGIINEPTAAGLAFGVDHGEDGRLVVFDFGGGTFDTTILDICGGNFQVMATDGDRDLGGSDIDNLLIEKVAQAFKAEHGVEISPQTDLPAHLETLAKCEIAKKTLSQAETASFMVSASGKRLVFDITRAEFNALIAPLVERTRMITQRALDAAKLQPKDIKDVLLVGGSSRIPLVREMLTELFGKKPRTDAKPDEAVAMGAAIFAARLGVDAKLAVVDTEGRKVLPPAPKIVDVNAHGLGCLAFVKDVELNCVIIPPNTPLPAEQEDMFALQQETQTEAPVVITQGRHHVPPSECNVIGEMVLKDLPPGPLVDRIRVKYGLAADGTLHITVTDTVSKKSTSDIKRGLAHLIAKTPHN
ncbi:MAG: Hsp70 family protein [Phycisphaerae bacterium]|nr:Hsp70 family protein [Phycisphaerae bacterium]